MTLTPTLKVIAAAAGVHVSTASRALDPARRHLVGDAVAAHVGEVARSLGYVRNVGAAALRTGRSKLIGIIVPDIANPVFGPILQGVEEALAAKGYSAIVSNAGGPSGDPVEVARHLIARRVDGLVSASAALNDPVVALCAAANVPLVLVNRAEAQLRTATVVSDDRRGMALAVSHLAGQGHRRIGHIAGPQNVSTGLWRRLGFEEAMALHGLPPGPVAVASAYTRAAGLAAARDLLAPGDLTALAVANDLLALGAYAAITGSGLRCPQDVAVVGYNDMPLVDLVDPPLTTVRIDTEELGRRAGRSILEAILNGTTTASLETVAPTLVIRGSTRVSAFG